MEYHEWTEAAFSAARKNGVQFAGGEFQQAFVGAVGMAWKRHTETLKRASKARGEQLAEQYLTIDPSQGEVTVE